MLEDVIQEWDGHEVTAMDVYSTMFHFGEGYLQKENEPQGDYKANPIAYYRNEGAKNGHYRIMFEDTFEETLAELQKADFCIINGLTYFGRKNVQSHASKMFAMIFDLDGVTDKTLNAFLNGAFVADAYPVPNYIVLSGHGVHLYYLFETPIPLYPNLKIQLKEFKYALTDRLWNPYTSTLKIKQRQGINQGFRVIGGRTKKDAKIEITRAFEINTHPFTLEQLSRYVPEAMKVDETKLFRESKLSLSQAKNKYPDWYQRVVVNKDKTRKRWEIEEKVHGDNPYALYDWWEEKIKEGAVYTHRYFCLMCLAIYGAKCNVPYEQVKSDAYSFVPFLNAINPDEPFTESDADSALECYDLKYCTFPLKDISMLSAIPIQKNKRNGRPQAVHMKIITSTRDVLYPDGSWRNKNGRPAGSGTKEKKVTQYVKEHPDASVTEIAKATGVSRPTVYKYKDVTPHDDYIVQSGRKQAVVETKEEKTLTEYDLMRIRRFKRYLEKMEQRKSMENKTDK